MSNLKVGDRVVCVDDSFELMDHTDICNLKKGRMYIVHSIKTCICGGDTLNVGAIVIFGDLSNLHCLFCDALLFERCRSSEFFSASRFRKVTEQPRVIRIEVERTEPVLN